MGICNCGVDSLGAHNLWKDRSSDISRAQTGRRGETNGEAKRLSNKRELTEEFISVDWQKAGEALYTIPVCAKRTSSASHNV